MFCSKQHKDLLIEKIIMSDSDMGTSSARFIGRVKWFNNKSGYGFITASTGDLKEEDVFVHHSSIEVSSQQYRYLVQGEYVEFSLVETSADSTHKFQTGNVTGINKGKLMCETHRDTRAIRSKTKDPEASDSKKPRVRGSGPRDNSSSDSKIAKTETQKEAMEE
jgi:cold shock protein